METVMAKPSNKPIKILAEKGEVIVDAPARASSSLTPEAAKKTAERMAFAAEQMQREKDPSIDSEADLLPDGLEDKANFA